MSRLRRELAATAGGLPATFWWLWAGMLVNALATFVFPFLALYLTYRGFSVATAGLVVSLLGAGAVLSGPLGGILADHIGRRRTMLLSLVLSAFVTAALGFVHTPAGIAAVVLVLGIVWQLFRPAAQATIADVVPPEGRPRAFGLTYWAVNLGIAVSLVVGGALAQRTYLGLFLADAVTTAAFALLVWRKVPETRPPEAAAAGESAFGGFLEALADPVFRPFLLLHLAWASILLQFHATAPIDMALHGISPGWFGLLMAVNGGVIALLQPIAARVMRRLDAGAVLALAAVLTGGGYGLFAFAHTPGPYAIAIAIFTLGEIAYTPVATAIVADLAPVALRGRYQGAFGMTWGLAIFAGPAVGSLVMNRFGGPALWGGCFALGILVAGGQLAAAGARRRRLGASIPLPGREGDPFAR